jgi:hypothetical protein
MRHFNPSYAFQCINGIMKFPRFFINLSYCKKSNQLFIILILRHFLELFCNLFTEAPFISIKDNGKVKQFLHNFYIHICLFLIKDTALPPVHRYLILLECFILFCTTIL